MQHSWAARLSNDVMSKEMFCIIFWILFTISYFFFPNTMDCLDIFWNDGKVRKGVRVLHESKPQDGTNQRSLWVLSCIHL